MLLETNSIALFLKRPKAFLYSLGYLYFIITHSFIHQLTDWHAKCKCRAFTIRIVLSPDLPAMSLFYMLLEIYKPNPVPLEEFVTNFENSCHNIWSYSWSSISDTYKSLATFFFCVNMMLPSLLNLRYYLINWKEHVSIVLCLLL